MSYNSPEAFFAYPSVPAASGDSIRKAVRDLNSGQVVRAKTWEDCKTGGKFIINTICQQIESSEIFCADLTGINPNVLFELGFAIALDKRIWLMIEPSYSEKKEMFERLRFLTTVGYAEFHNSRDIVDQFYKDEPYVDPTNHGLYSQMIAPSAEMAVPGRLLYIKSLVESEASIQIGTRIASSPIPQTVDDPTEVTVQTLGWYGYKTMAAEGVICHIMAPERSGYLLNNARNAFVAGLAYGLKKPLLLLAEGNILGPLDYRDISKHYQSSEKALQFLEEWLTPIETAWSADEKLKEGFQSKIKRATELKTLQLGEPLAENESDGLIEHYFVETTAFRDAVNGRHTIFVGRKGAGKSANFLKLAATARRDPTNLVCEIKPISYELQSITELVARITENSAKGYMLEAVWKFLIYSEIANTLAREGREYRSEADEADHKRLLKFLEKNGGMLREEFSLRLEHCIASLSKQHTSIAEAKNQEERQKAIAHALHEDLLSELRLLLGKLLSDRKNVYVLVDNLDKSWDKQSDLKGLSEFFLGLIGAVKRIGHDFRRSDSRLESISLSMVVFLRSDIFLRIRSIAREPDKLDYFQLNWDDPELLLRLIEERFVALHAGNVTPAEIWKKYFVQRVNGVPTRNYFVSKVLPRPRDLIVLIKAAISTAVNRGHIKVETADIIEAEKIYSRFAVDSLLVEDGMAGGTLGDVIYQFLGSESVVDRASLFDLLSNAGVPENKLESYTEQLCSLTFLGPEIHNGDFRFADGPDENNKNNILAGKLASKNRKPIRYQINQAFWPYLEVSESLL